MPSIRAPEAHATDGRSIHPSQAPEPDDRMGPQVVLQGSWELETSVSIRDWLHWPLAMTIEKVMVPEPRATSISQQPEAGAQELGQTVARGMGNLSALLDGTTNRISQETVLTASEMVSLCSGFLL